MNRSVVLRLVAGVGSVLAVLASGLDSALPPTWLWLLVAVLSTGHALAPESDLGIVAMLVVLAWWGLGPMSGQAPPPSSVLAAATLLCSHVAAVVLSYGPLVRLDGAVLRTWLVRTSVAVLTAPAAWLLAVATRGRAEPLGLWEAGLLVAGVATVVAGVAFSVGPARQGGPAPGGRSRRAG